jgi:hypothetical protein
MLITITKIYLQIISSIKYKFEPIVKNESRIFKLKDEFDESFLFATSNCDKVL